jgi:hypothetical protein
MPYRRPTTRATVIFPSFLGLMEARISSPVKVLYPYLFAKAVLDLCESARIFLERPCAERGLCGHPAKGSPSETRVQGRPSNAEQLCKRRGRNQHPANYSAIPMLFSGVSEAHSSCTSPLKMRRNRISYWAGSSVIRNTVNAPSLASVGGVNAHPCIFESSVFMRFLRSDIHRPAQTPHL